MSESPPSLPWRHTSEGVVPASVDRVFAHLDDQVRLASHMERPSWGLGGGQMHVEFDAARGRAVGARIAMTGRAFGIELALEEVVTERQPPVHKAWETRGTPRLLVIGAYRMEFDLEPMAGGSKLRVAIDYALPDSGFGRVLGRLFAPAYARWCTKRMVDDAVGYFSQTPRGGESDGR